MTYIEQALEIAKNMPREKGKHRICAIAVDRKGSIVSIGTNNYTKSHPVQKRYANKANLYHKCFLHAEIAAIIKARGKKIDKLVIARASGNNKAAMAAPCPVCTIAIKEAGIKTVEFTTGE